VKKVPMRRKLVRVLVSVLVGISLSAVLYVTGASVGLDRGLRDLWARRFVDRKDFAASSIELIYIDQYSLTWVEKNLFVSWPWPRELYGLMASFLGESSAQAYDIVFSEASSYGPEDDLRCAQGMDAAGNVVLAVVAGGNINANSVSRLTAIPARNVGYGQVRAFPDTDGVLRRYEVWASPKSTSGREDSGLPALGYALWLKSLASKNKVNSVQKAEVFPPDSGSKSGKSVLLRFKGKSPSFSARNAAEVLASAIDWRNGKASKLSPSDFKGKFVFVGLNAPGLLDRQAVPTDPAMPGMEIHATFLDNFLSNSFLSPIPMAWELLALIAFTVILAFVANRFRTPLALALATILSLAIPAATGAILFSWGIVLHAVAFMGAGIGVAASAIVLAYSNEGRQRLFLRKAFAQYLSPSVIDKVVENPGALRLGGESRPITVFFSDVQGFTTLSETLEPAKLTEFMNFYLSMVSSAILEEGGTLDKYIGDAVVAFWNAPLAQMDHGRRAIRAAVNAQRRLKAAEPEFLRLCGVLPFTRIGIHSGEAVVGNMGSQARFNYTALGDAVNTASRLEGANKELDTVILVSSETVKLALGDAMASMEEGSVSIDGISLRKLGVLKLVGKMASVEVWAPDTSTFETGRKLPTWEGIRVLGTK
jgi:adenylate cyclase